MGILRRLGFGKGKERELPIPPMEMRQLVGPTDPALFDNPTGEPMFAEYVPDTAYDSVFDFGCGCGRVARQLMQQKPKPKRYLGIDIHRDMIRWDQKNLTPADQNFRFMHHDVYSISHGAKNTKNQLTAPFEADDSSFSLTLAWSVFTHIYEEQTVHYLKEMRRILRPDGYFLSTWFVFEKREFPMMQQFQNTLFINWSDPTNAVIYDREWLKKAVDEADLEIVQAHPPSLRGYHWYLVMRPKGSGIEGVDFPPDTAPYGSMPPPLLPNTSRDE